VTADRTDNQFVVLVVEDDHDMRNYYKTVLEHAGFMVVEADSYDQAITCLDGSIDIALLDVVLGDKSGLNILKYIHQKFPLCPSIMISAHADKDSAIIALKAGAVDYLEKPVDHYELVQTIQHWIDITVLNNSELRLHDYRSAYEALNDSAELLSGILESTAEAVISVDEDQHIILFNKGAEETFGYRRDEILGMPLEVLLPQQSRAGHHAKVAAFEGSVLRSRYMTTRGEIEGCRKNGELFPAEASISKIQKKGKYIVTAVLRDISDRKKAEKELQRSFVESIYMLMRAAEFRDDETGAHVKRISQYSKMLAEHMGMDELFCDNIYYASALHDIGKIGIPDHILLKNGKLMPDEWEVMKGHAEKGAKILAGQSSSYLQMGMDLALSHHERWDGGGYPQGLKGEEIPLPARIMQLADVYDALRSKRPYKEPFTHTKSMQIICQGDGRTEPEHFDPTVMTAFKYCSDQLDEIYNRYHEDT